MQRIYRRTLSHMPPIDDADTLPPPGHGGSEDRTKPTRYPEPEMWTNFLVALNNIREQRGRFALSALGVTVATIAIVLLVSIAVGVKGDVSSQIDDLGVNLLIVLPGRVEEGNFNPNLGGQSFLAEVDAKRVRGVEGVLRTSTLTFAGGGVRYGKKEAYPMTVAATADWFIMHPDPLVEGRNMTSLDESKAVAVLGDIAKEALFGKASAIGKKVKINGLEYEVIGVTEDKKKSEGGSNMFSMFGFQNMAYVPYSYLKSKQPTTQIDRIMIQTAPSAEPKELKKAVDAELGKRLNRQQYSVLTQDDLLGLVYKLMGILTWLLTGLTSIALFVGGVGIMTVMLMSVNERSKEIGIRKTVGAKQRDIFAQFLSESILISSAGGVAGLMVSYAACLALYRLTPVKATMTLPIVALALGVGIVVGAVFGLLPAMKAARKDPISAMRNE
ncbi:MAG: ABC transporter permease [Fimbriimonadaceae bacterium]